MKKIPVLFAAIALVLTSGGCTATATMMPLARTSEFIETPELTGSWIMQRCDRQEPSVVELVFSPEDKLYYLTEREAGEERLQAALVTLDGAIYGSVTADLKRLDAKLQHLSGFERAFLVPIYGTVKLEPRPDGTITVYLVSLKDADWREDAVEHENIRAFSACTGQEQAALLKNRDSNLTTVLFATLARPETADHTTAGTEKP